MIWMVASAVFAATTLVAALRARRLARNVLTLQQIAVQRQKLATQGELAATLVHEVKNALTGVIAFAQLGQRSAGEREKTRELLAMSEKEALRCREMLVDFLAVAAQPRESAPLDVNALVTNAARVIGRQLELNKVALRTELGDGLAPIHGRAAELHQVILNLALNAQQAMPDGGTVHLRTRGSGANRVLIEVTDDGPGIPEHLRSRIFEPFFTTKSRGEGTGLGLAISADIVRAHNGQISVASKLGAGSTFTIDLPAGSAP